MKGRSGDNDHTWDGPPREPGTRLPGSGAKKGVPMGTHYLDEFTQARIVTMTRGGMPVTEISKAIGRGHDMLAYWLRKGQQDDTNDEDTEYRQLYLAWAQAEAEFIQECITLWRAQFKSDWRAIQGFMGRRFPKSWGAAAEAAAAGGDVVDALRVALKAEEYDAI